MNRNPVCPGCNHSFSIRDSSHIHNTKQPLLLQCGHSCCENCLNKATRSKKDQVSCTVCKAVTDLSTAEKGIKSLLPDVYINGVLYVNRSSRLDIELKRLTPAGCSTQKAKRDLVTGGTMKAVMCGECKVNFASCRCVKCASILCGLCFEKIHDGFNILRGHQASELDSDLPEDEEKRPQSQRMMCTIHKKPIEYFCEEDHSLTCSSCVISGDHKNHEVTSMEDKNKTYVDDLEPLVRTAARVLKRLKASEKGLNQAEPDYTNDLNKLVGEVKAHFRWLHGSLQIREMEIIKELMEHINSTSSDRSGVLQDMKSQLKQAQNNLSGLVQDAKKVISNNNEVILNGKDILDQLTEASDIPCSLVRREEKDQFDLRVEWPSDIHRAIQQYGSVVGTLEPTLTLVSLSESGPDIPDTVSEPDSIISSSVCDSDVIIEEENEESLSETASTVSRSLSRQSSVEPRRNQPRSIRTRSSQNQVREVEVTHIRDPSCFMVQQCSDLKALNTLLRNINKWANNPENEKHRPDNVTIGQKVLAKYTKDGKWYRARVKNFTTVKADVGVPDKDELNKEKTDKEEPHKEETDKEEPDKEETDKDETDKEKPKKDVLVSVEVVYYDFGNSEVVPIDRVLKMQTRFNKHPEFAIECCLYDIVHLEQESRWTQDAINTLFDMTNEKKMSMSVIQEVNNVLHVDLCKPPTADIEDDCPISVRDALVFLELANFYSHAHPSATPQGYKPNRQFMRPEPKYCRDMFEAVITHCNSPDSFYVQELCNSRYLFDMMLDMQEVYGSDRSGLWNILCPQKGMVCAAAFDNTWRRARVVSLPGNRMVQVHYVDFGNMAVVPLVYLKKLLDRFMCLPVFAIHSQLADVIPLDEGGWSQKALESCSLMLDKTKCSATVTKTTQEKIHLKLLAVIDDLQYCINWKLVRDKLAVSTGPSSKLPKAKVGVGSTHQFLVSTNVVKAEADTTSDTTSDTGISETNKPKSKKSSLPNRRKGRQDVISSFLDLPHTVSSSSMSSLTQEDTEDTARHTEKTRQADTSSTAQTNGMAPPGLTAHRAGQTVSISSSPRDSTEEESQNAQTAKKKAMKKKRVASINASPVTGKPLKVVIKPPRNSPTGLQVVVTSCESPGKIYLQMATAKQDGLENLMKAMGEAYSRTSPAVVSWKSGDYCAVKREDGNWYRGRIERKISDTEMEVFMEDFGFTEHMDTSDLQGLSDRFIQNYGNFCQRCHIADITPSGDLTRWSQTAIEFVRRELARSTCYLVKKGDKDEAGSQPIDLLMEVVIKETALEPATRDYYSLCEKLKELGLAMPIRRKVPKPEVIKENPASAALAVLSQTHPPAKSGDGVTTPTCASPTSPTSPIVEPHIMLNPPRVFFKPPVIPVGTAGPLHVIPTYVDYGCVIYVHLMDRNDETDQLLHQVVESMQKYFNQPTLYGAPSEWVVGQGCAAIYSADNHWHRCKVIEVPANSDQIRVQYIDYGNSVWLSKDRVRADVTQFDDIPQLAVECVLRTIRPFPTEDQKEVWSTPVLEAIHDLLVNKDCTAEIEGLTHEGQLYVQLSLPGGEDVVDYLVSHGLAFKVLDIAERKALSKSILHALEANNPYDRCDLPPVDQTFSVLVTHLDLVNVVYFQRGRPGLGETDDYSNKVSKELTLLEQLSVEINSFAPTALLFEKPRPGAPCCAQFSADGCWYRALMISIKENKREAFVYFVDYGNSEFVPFDNLRIMPAQFMMLPAQASRCLVSNIAPPAGQSWDQETLETMIALLGNNYMKAQLTSAARTAAVLYSVEAGLEGQFVYQSLVEQGLLVLTDTNQAPGGVGSREWGDLAEDDEEIDYQNKIDLGSSSTDTTLDDKSEGAAVRSSDTGQGSDPTTTTTTTDDDSDDDDDDSEEEEGSDKMESNV